MFWDSPERETISISAGTLDAASGLRVSGHVYVAQACDYYEPPADGAAPHQPASDPLGRDSAGGSE